MAETAAMEEQQERASGLLDVDAQLVDDIAALLDAGQRGMVSNLVADLRSADVAMLLSHLPFEEAQQLFRWLNVEQASEVVAELDGSLRSALLESVDPGHITTLLDELDTDDAADVLAELPNELAQQVLPSLANAEDLRALLGYDEETAGGIMGTEFVAVPVNSTVAEATEEVRHNAETVEHVYTVFVVDAQGRLQGTLPLKRLLLSPSDAPISSIMEPDAISVTTDVDQEEVARVMERYDLISLPVVDAAGVLVGRITIDDVVDVIREEAEEDLQLMSGVTGGEEPTHSVLRISRGRLPWLLAGMLGAGLSGTVIGSFEGKLEQAIVLASFIPIVTAMGGNAAVQSAAIAVQGLSSGELWVGDVFRRIVKELAVALVNGMALALLLGGLVLVVGLGAAPWRLAATVALTMFAVIILATTNGALVPFMLKHFDIDPASAMGPFVTTLNDIVGLTVYFLIASVLYL